MLVKRLKNMKACRESKKVGSLSEDREYIESWGGGEGGGRRGIGMLSFPMKLVLIKSAL